MRRLLFHAILSLLTICLCACSGDVVKKPEKFFKQEEALPRFAMKNAKIYDIEGKEYIYAIADERDAICSIDIATSRMDTIAAISQTINDFCYNSDSKIIWAAVGSHRTVWNSKTCTEIPCPCTKHYGEYITWAGVSAYHPFFSSGNILYTGIIPTEALTDFNYDYAGFRKKASLIAAWDISNPNSVRCVKIFGKRPSDQPKDMFIDDCYQTAFNVEDSIIVAGTELSQNVVVMTMSGKTLREKKLSSKFYVKPEKKDFSQNHSATEKIKYWEENMLFRGLFYDKYRKLYYRILQLPKQEDKSSFTKRKQDWVLIVADSKLNKKYEVKFDGDKYRWAILIGKQGVYVLKDKTMDLFVFD